MTLTDLQARIDGIQRLCGDVRQIAPMLDEMLDLLQQALSALLGIDDQHARLAEAQIREAQAALREARAVWLDDYVRRSEELSRRIAS